MKDPSFSRPPDPLAYALFVLLWCAATALWPVLGSHPRLPRAENLLLGPKTGGELLAPPGAGSLLSIPNLGAWRAERVAEALWEGLVLVGPDAQRDLEAVPGIGPVSSQAVLAVYPALVRLLHWREPNPRGTTDSGQHSHVHPDPVPLAQPPTGPP